MDFSSYGMLHSSRSDLSDVWLSGSIGFPFFVGANRYHLNSLLMYRTRHLGFRLARRRGFFQSSISHYPNSVSTFNITRLIVSGEISVNPGPDDFQFIPSRISDSRCCPLSNAYRRRNITNLTEIRRVTSAATPIQVQLTLCTLNARSLRNKSALFFDYL